VILAEGEGKGIFPVVNREATSDSLISRTLGHYGILDRIAGGMGVIYKAEDKPLHFYPVYIEVFQIIHI
jgi:hypothetical protein